MQATLAAFAKRRRSRHILLAISVSHLVQQSDVQLKLTLGASG
jgi:hypothetical protein